MTANPVVRRESLGFHAGVRSTNVVWIGSFLVLLGAALILLVDRDKPAEPEAIPAPKVEPTTRPAKPSKRDAEELAPGREALRKIERALASSSPEKAVEGFRELIALHEKTSEELMTILRGIGKSPEATEDPKAKTLLERMETLNARFMEARQAYKDSGQDPALIEALMQEHTARLSERMAVQELKEEAEKR